MNAPTRAGLALAFDPERFRADGHRLVDRLSAYLADALASRSARVLPAGTPEQRAAQTPAFGEGPTGDLHDVVEEIIAGSLVLHDPRTTGHQDGVPLPTAALGAFLASVLNNDPSVFETGPAVVGMEGRLIDWLTREIGFPSGASGVITSGGSLGNLTALLAARQAKAGFDAWHDGAHAGEKLCVLTSEQTHYCVSRAVQIMGFGRGGCVTVPVDEAFRLDVRALPAAYERARAAGRRPIAIVASACTTATSSFDPLGAIADFCAERGLWLHVDGAHGAVAALSPRHRHLVAGIERADSVVWDGHKMMLMPSLFTAVLFRDGRRSYETFRQEATYLFEGRPDEEWYNSGNRTVECTKTAMATRLYLALRVHGIGLFRDYVARSFDLAARFAEILRDAPDFELAVAPEGNLVSFRHVPPGARDLDALQATIRERLLARGDHYITKAVLRDANWLRVSLVHPLLEEAHLLRLLDAIRKAAAGA